MSQIIKNTGDWMQIIETISPDYFIVLQGNRKTDEWDLLYVTANGLGVLCYPYIYRKGFWTSSDEGPPGKSPWMHLSIPPCGPTALSDAAPTTQSTLDGQTLVYSQGAKKLVSKIPNAKLSSIVFSTSDDSCGTWILSDIIHFRFGVPGVLTPAIS